MQFPVPQFTDVEDKIIGPLTIKQFGIIFGTGIILFLGYSATKSILVLIFLFMLFGLPGLGLAFGKINGRPIYNSIGFFIQFYMSPKLLVFHKQPKIAAVSANKQKIEEKPGLVTQVAAQTPASTRDNLRKIQELLRQTEDKEKQILSENKQN